MAMTELLLIDYINK